MWHKNKIILVASVRRLNRATYSYTYVCASLTARGLYLSSDWEAGDARD